MNKSIELLPRVSMRDETDLAEDMQYGYFCFRGAMKLGDQAPGYSFGAEGNQHSFAKTNLCFDPNAKCKFRRCGIYPRGNSNTYFLV